MIGVLPSQGADPIPVRLSTEAAGAGMIEKNEVRMIGVLPSQGADPIPVVFGEDSLVCRIKTGTYTGDGTLGQAIIGVGVKPKFLMIFGPHPTSEVAVNIDIKLDQLWADYSAFFGPGVLQYYDNHINSLDDDGFTVDDGGANLFPNANGVVYDYLVLG